MLSIPMLHVRSNLTLPTVDLLGEGIAYFSALLGELITFLRGTTFDLEPLAALFK
ncbi:hypothetical protein [Salsuginibacillus kocurii]|uniref:hypothetical protein n=1 Tax=Salsuginibacillus kocurii TaxID=427078 RepID=UPI0003601C1B|nr:hypothetical protein [Salsuginibacillus kocurii]